MKKRKLISYQLWQIAGIKIRSSLSTQISLDALNTVCKELWDKLKNNNAFVVMTDVCSSRNGVPSAQNEKVRTP